MLSKRSCSSKIWKEILREMRQYSTLTVCILYVSSKRDLLQRSQGVVLNKWKKEGQKVTMYLEEVEPENPKLTRWKQNWQGIRNQIIFVLPGLRDIFFFISGEYYFVHVPWSKQIWGGGGAKKEAKILKNGTSKHQKLPFICCCTSTTHM